MGLTSFQRRLLGVVVAFYVGQTTGFAVFQAFFHLPAPWDWVFYPATAAYHVLVWLGLWSIKNRFTTLDGAPLQRLGLPNLLTLFRLTSLPIITLVFLLARTHPSLAMPLVIFVSVAFLTDLFDGFLARTLRLGTQLGKLLDSSTDYVILFSLTVVLGGTSSGMAARSWSTMSACGPTVRSDASTVARNAVISLAASFTPFMCTLRMASRPTRSGRSTTT